MEVVLLLLCGKISDHFDERIERYEKVGKRVGSLGLGMLSAATGIGLANQTSDNITADIMAVYGAAVPSYLAGSYAGEKAGPAIGKGAAIGVNTIEKTIDSDDPVGYVREAVGSAYEECVDFVQGSR